MSKIKITLQEHKDVLKSTMKPILLYWCASSYDNMKSSIHATKMRYLHPVRRIIKRIEWNTKCLLRTRGSFSSNLNWKYHLGYLFRLDKYKWKHLKSDEKERETEVYFGKFGRKYKNCGEKHNIYPITENVRPSLLVTKQRRNVLTTVAYQFPFKFTKTIK